MLILGAAVNLRFLLTNCHHVDCQISPLEMLESGIIGNRSFGPGVKIEQRTDGD